MPTAGVGVISQVLSEENDGHRRWQLELRALQLLDGEPHLALPGVLRACI